MNLVDVFWGNQTGSEIFEMIQTFEIIAVMSAHLINSDTRSFPFNRFAEMYATNIHTLFNCWSRDFSPVFKNAGSPERSTDNLYWPDNHDSVYAVFAAHFLCLFRRIHVAITEDRNVNSRIVFDGSDRGPVSCAFVHLFAGTTVHSECLYSDIL